MQVNVESSLHQRILDECVIALGCVLGCSGVASRAVRSCGATGVLDGISLAHLASVLPDGDPYTVPVWIGTHGEYVAIITGPRSRKARNLRRDPRVALSPTAADDQFQPRGRVIEWVEGDAAWTIVDQLATKYIGQPYSRAEERVVALIQPEQQTVGIE